MCWLDLQARAVQGGVFMVRRHALGSCLSSDGNAEMKSLTAHSGHFKQSKQWGASRHESLAAAGVAQLFLMAIVRATAATQHCMARAGRALAHAALQLERHELVHLGSKLQRQLIKYLRVGGTVKRGRLQAVLPPIGPQHPVVCASGAIPAAARLQRMRQLPARQRAWAHLAAEARDDHAHRVLHVNAPLQQAVAWAGELLAGQQVARLSGRPGSARAGMDQGNTINSAMLGTTTYTRRHAAVISTGRTCWK